MRVAFVTVGDTSRRTGGYLYDARVVAGLRGAGLEVEEVIACGAAPGEQEASSQRFGLTFDPRPFDVVVVDALARVVCAPHLDRWRRERPLVAMVHELPAVADPGRALYERRFEGPLLRANLLVCVSRHGKAILEKRGVEPGRIRVVPPGFDRLSARRGGAGRTGPLRVLCVAQWIERKGILDLVEAWSGLETEEASLILAGEQDADPSYASVVRDALRETPGVEAVGAVADGELARLYAASDIFVLPSRYEGYGLVYAEALSFGLPVVACDTGPVPELVGEAGILVPPGDRRGLRGALGRLLSDAGLREALSRVALQRARELPRWEETVEGFLEVLQEAVGMRLGEDFLEENRRSWNAAAEAHESHRGALAGFLREGGSALFPEERSLLGDVAGKRVLHLQSGAGPDSVSLALLGAEVTGVDMSDEAVAAARSLAERVGVEVRFERAEICGWMERAAEGGRRFDAAFASYGVVCWIPDLGRWARAISGILAPGGCFVLVEFHPAADMFAADWSHSRSYPAGGVPEELEEGVGDYVGQSGGGLTPAGFEPGMEGFSNPHRAVLFRWGLGEVITALAGAGLFVRELREYPYSNGERHFERMRELPGRRMIPPDDVPEVPLMYGLRAEKA